MVSNRYQLLRLKEKYGDINLIRATYITQT